MLSRIPESPRVRNRLVAALPIDEYERLLPKFEPVTVTTKELITVEERPLEYAYFPETCVLSLLAQTDPSTFTEIATVGREGMLGTPLLFGLDTTPHRSFGQMPGDCLRIPAETLRREVDRGGPFVTILHRYMQM